MGNINQREMLVARWTELVADASLRDVPYKIELNAEGTIEMSPANNWHAATQAYLAWALKDGLPDGVVYTECSVLTSIGVRVPDVAWASMSFVAAEGHNTPFSRAPEICIEITSPSNSKREIDAKVEAFLAAGAQEVWIAESDGRLALYGTEGVRTASVFGLQVQLPGARR